MTKKTAAIIDLIIRSFRIASVTRRTEETTEQPATIYENMQPTGAVAHGPDLALTAIALLLPL